MTLPAYALRAARADDLEPMMHIGHDGIRPWVEALWGRWDDKEQQRSFRERFDLTTTSIVVVEGVDVGYIRLEREGDHDFLAGIFLAAPHRNRGIGRAILIDLMKESSATGRPLRLRVLRPNPARWLYERLGFRVTEATDTHFYMEASPAPRAP